MSMLVFPSASGIPVTDSKHRAKIQNVSIGAPRRL